MLLSHKHLNKFPRRRRISPYLVFKGRTPDMPNCWGLRAASVFQEAANLMIVTDSSCGWTLNLGKETRCVLGGIQRWQPYLSRRKGRWGWAGGRALHNSQLGLARGCFKTLTLIFQSLVNKSPTKRLGSHVRSMREWYVFRSKVL